VELGHAVDHDVGVTSRVVEREVALLVLLPALLVAAHGLAIALEAVAQSLFP